jgi:pimeloyl-[acyl-carrier protein] methyl ester esterase
MKSWSNYIKILGSSGTSGSSSSGSSGSSGQSLVFFHGWGFDHIIWLDLVSQIQDRFSIYLVDLPGFGNSPLISWQDFSAALLASLPAQFVLIGWSMGGLFATRLALEAPLRVSRLIHVASSPFFVKSTGWPGIDADNLQSFRSNLLQAPESSVQQFIRQCSPSHTGIIPVIKEEQLQGLIAGLDVLKTWDFREALDTLVCPTYYLFGRNDSIVPRTTLKIMQKNYSNPKLSYLLFENAAHDPFITEPDRFIAEMEKFLA